MSFPAVHFRMVRNRSVYDPEFVITSPIDYDNASQ